MGRDGEGYAGDLRRASREISDFRKPFRPWRRECWYRRTPSPLVRFVPIEFIIGRKRPVAGGQMIERGLAPVFLPHDQRPFRHIDDGELIAGAQAPARPSGPRAPRDDCGSPSGTRAARRPFMPCSNVGQASHGKEKIDTSSKSPASVHDRRGLEVWCTCTGTPGTPVFWQVAFCRAAFANASVKSSSS